LGIKIGFFVLQGMMTVIFGFLIADYAYQKIENFSGFSRTVLATFNIVSSLIILGAIFQIFFYLKDIDEKEMRRAIKGFGIIYLLAYLAYRLRIDLRDHHPRALLSEALGNAFTEATGIKVVFTTYPTYAQMEAQVKSGNIEWDIVESENRMYARGLKAGIFEPIDLSQINTQNFVEGSITTPHDAERIQISRDPVVRYANGFQGKDVSLSRVVLKIGIPCLLNRFDKILRWRQGGKIDFGNHNNARRLSHAAESLLQRKRTSQTTSRLIQRIH
jgi:hypothetical protein